MLSAPLHTLGKWASPWSIAYVSTAYFKKWRRGSLGNGHALCHLRSPSGLMHFLTLRHAACWSPGTSGTIMSPSTERGTPCQVSTLHGWTDLVTYGVSLLLLCCINHLFHFKFIHYFVNSSHFKLACFPQFPYSLYTPASHSHTTV